jgi:prepilin-type N-terminal cleavage/methylation domain-containing protein
MHDTSSTNTRNRPSWIRRGYTLVELLVAIALTGILFVVTWVMFATSSDVLGEVDSLTHATDRLRFAVERVRADLQTAGSLGTISAAQDPFVQPKDAAWRVDALYTYSTWQDDRTVLPPEIAAVNPNVSFDGFVVMGAYDNPLGFEIGAIPVNLQTGMIVGNSRGLHKLHVPDPFRTAPAYPIDFTSFAHVEPIAHQWTTRIMRIMDPSGFMHFVRIRNELTAGDLTNSPTGVPAVTVRFDTADHPPQARNGQPFGLDISAESDRYYEAALLDMFWYHVRQDPNDPTNMQLVRERLCAPAALPAIATNYATWDPASFRADNSMCPGGVPEVIVIADKVVDFQVWFDCSNAWSTPLAGSAWNTNWLTPDHTGTGTDRACMNPGTANTGLARVGHIRLSVRADSERPNQRHIQFENASGATCDPDAPAGCDPTTFPGARLQTYDIAPGLDGAAPVVTLQSTVSMPNFRYR